MASHIPRFLAVACLLLLASLPRPGVATPVVSFAPDTLKFAPLPVGEGVGGIVTLFNTGTTDLIISTAYSTNLVFGVTTWMFPIVVPPGGFGNILNRFEPADTVFYEAFIVVECNDPVTPVVMIPVTGQGLPGPPPEIEVVPTFVTQDVITGQQNSANFRIWNHGTQVLHYSIDDSTLPAWYGLSQTSGDITESGSNLIWVNYDATGIPEDSTVTDTIYVDHNDTTQASVAVTVEMNVVRVPTPEIVLSDTAFVFPDRFVPNGYPDVLTISNMGTDPLTGSMAATTNQWFISDPNFSVQPGFMHYTTVEFAPTVSGVHDDTLLITSNDPVNPLVAVQLYGRAVDLSAFICTPDTLFVTLPPAGKHTFSVDIQHPGGFDCGFVTPSRVIHPDDPQGAVWPGTLPAVESHVPGPVVETPAEWETGVAAPGNGVVRSELDRETAPGGETAASAATAIVPMPFVDGFEDGDYAGWQAGGATAVHTITSTAAANGSAFSLRETQSEAGHSNGLYVDFGFVKPTYVSFWVRPTSTTQNTCYVTFHDRDFNEVIFFFALQTGQFYINNNVGGNTSVTYQADTWYHIELRNMNFDTQSFDYYVDDALIQAGVPFRNAGSITNIARMDIYNHTANATGYWDEFEIKSDYPTWIVANTDTVIVPAGETQDAKIYVDATGLAAGTYLGYVDINSVDRPVTIATIPVTITVDTTITSVSGEAPSATALKQNYPNPFNPTTNIEFYVHDGGHAELTVFDVGGRHVRTLFSRDRALGRYVVSWDGRDQGGERVASGIYFYRLQTGDTATTRKMVLLK